jgi:hypothetical protein
MKKNGRYSKTELSLVPRRELPRSEPPATLSESGKQIWRDVVACFRPDWFQGAEAILAAYCQTAVTERQIAGVITECGVQDERWPEFIRLYCNVTSSLVPNPVGSRRLVACVRL